MENTKKCYNSFSCILSVLIIVFVLVAVIYDIAIGKPQMRKGIDEIKIEISEINKKIDLQSTYILGQDTTKLNK